MRYSSDHKAQTRERILEVAAGAIRKHGVEGVSLSAIMAGADLTNGAFYAHFKSKDDLIAKAVTFMFDHRYARLLASVETNTLDAKEALATFIDRYLSMRHCEAPEAGCPIPPLAAEVPHMTKEARVRFAAGVSRLVNGLAALLDQAGVADPKAHASSTVAELVGALGLARTAEDPVAAKAMLSASRSALKQRLGLSAIS